MSSTEDLLIRRLLEKTDTVEVIGKNVEKLVQERLGPNESEQAFDGGLAGGVGGVQEFEEILESNNISYQVPQFDTFHVASVSSSSGRGRIRVRPPRKLPRLLPKPLFPEENPLPILSNQGNGVRINGGLKNPPRADVRSDSALVKSLNSDFFTVKSSQMKWFETTVRSAIRVNFRLSQVLQEFYKAHNSTGGAFKEQYVFNSLQKILNTSINSLIQLRNDLWPLFSESIQTITFPQKDDLEIVSSTTSEAENPNDALPPLTKKPADSESQSEEKPESEFSEVKSKKDRLRKQKIEPREDYGSLKLLLTNDVKEWKVQRKNDLEYLTYNVRDRPSARIRKMLSVKVIVKKTSSVERRIRAYLRNRSYYHK